MERRQFPKLALILLAFLLVFPGASWGQKEEEPESIHVTQEEPKPIHVTQEQPEPIQVTEEEFEPIHVGVTPFVNITGNKEFDWLSIGISECLCTKLASLPYLTLVERARLSEALKEIEMGQMGLIDEATAAKTGQMAGAEELVVGSYQIVGEKIRIHARFVDVDEGKIKKTAEATGNMDQIFDLQDQIAASFLDNLQLPITQEEKPVVSTKPTESLEAYKLYSQAMDAYTPEGRSLDDEKRIELLNRSARIDPHFFLAFISLGDLYARRRDASGYHQAATYYNRAVTIRPNYITPRNRLVKVYRVQGNTAALQREQAKITEIRRTFTRSQAGKEKIRVLKARPPKPWVVYSRPKPAVRTPAPLKPSVGSPPPKPSPALKQPRPVVRTAPPRKSPPASTVSRPPVVAPPGPRPPRVSRPPQPSPPAVAPFRPPGGISPAKPSPAPTKVKPPVVSPAPKPYLRTPPPKAPVVKRPTSKPKPKAVSKPPKPPRGKTRVVAPKPKPRGKPKRSKKEEDKKKQKRR